MEGDAARMESWERGLQAEANGAAAWATGAQPCRGDAAAGESGARRRDHRGRVGTIAVEASQIEPSTQV